MEAAQSAESSSGERLRQSADAIRARMLREEAMPSPRDSSWLERSSNWLHSAALEEFARDMSYSVSET